MNTKGIKFLAVLAVLAMAFAAFAVMTDTEQNSAAIPEEVTTVTTEKDFRTAITGDKEFNVKLGANIVIDAEGKQAYLVKSAGVIDFNGYTLTVKKELTKVDLTDTTLNVGSDPKANDNGLKSVIVNESKGLTLKDTSENAKGGIIYAYGTTSATAEKAGVLYNAPNAVMTIDSGSYTVDNGTIEYGVIETTKSYWYTVKNLGTMVINGGYIAGMNHFWAKQLPASNCQASSTIVNGWWDGSLKGTAAAPSLTINGGVIEYGNYLKLDDCSKTIINGGTIKNGLNGALMNVGKVDINALTIEGNNTGIQNITCADYGYSVGEMNIGCDLTINGNLKNSGTITLDDATVTVNGAVTIESGQSAGTFELKGSSGLVFGEGTTIPEGFAFKYTDEYGDVHSFKNTAAIKVGISGLRITASEYSIMVSGTIILETATAFEFTGNASISGTVYTEGNKLTLGSTNSNADLKIFSFQATTTTATAEAGDVELAYSALVSSGSFFVAGNLIVDAGMILKVAEGSTVKTEGKLAASAANDANKLAAAQVWNAGVVNATGYALTKDATTDNIGAGQLFSLFMNNTKTVGTFYKGTDIFDPYTSGTPPARVISDAYGAYLDMTGKSVVNIASGAISVENKLYRYNTLILATFSDTIALSVVTDNQYKVDISLEGKDPASIEKGEKFATFSGVNWNSANSAKIKITAPEVYTVVLVEKYKADGTTIDSVWTDGLVVKDSTGRVIPISQADEEEEYDGGEVKLVYGEKYTITGAITANDYGFEDVKKVFSDLEKKSQTQGSFTMIRNLAKTTGDTPVEDPAQIYVTMGKATVVTVDLKDAENMIAAGDVVLSYSVDDGKTYTDVIKPADSKEKITFNVFSNQTVLLKYPSITYFKFTPNFDTETVITPATETTPAVKAAENVTEQTVTDKQRETGCVNAFVIADDTAAKVTAKFTLTCELDAQTLTFEQVNTTVPDEDAILTITFEEGKYYIENTGATTKGHGAEVTIDFSKDNQKNPLTVYKGEVFSMTWTDIEDVREKMTYAGEYAVKVTASEGGTVTADKNKAKAGEVVTLTITKEDGKVLTGLTINGKDLTNASFVMPAEDVEIVATFGAEDGIDITETVPESTTGAEYVSGTAFTVDGSYVFTLALVKINYVDVKNSTDTETKIYDNDVAKDGVTLEAQKLKEKAIEQIDNNIVKLSIEGSYVISWSYKLTLEKKTGDNEAPTVTGTVSGAAASFNFEKYTYGEETRKVTDMEITTINSEKIVYFVHMKTTNYTKFDGRTSTGGYFGETMYVYADVKEGGLLNQIRVYYEISDGVLSDKFFYATKDGDHWKFTLPASSVTLVPEDESNVAKIKFVNYDGTVLQDTEQPKGAMPVYSGPTPTKPATETEVYEFAGWDPELVDVTEDATYTATFKTVPPTSKNVTIFLEKAQGGVKVTLLANDGRFLQDGSIEFTYYYAYELNGKWATGFKTFTAQTGEIDDKSLFQFTVDLSEQERFAETMWIEGTYTSADEAVNAASELIVYQ